jgi:hypothetical protein
LISAQDTIQQAIVDLVGDLAAYRPGSKLVVFESTEAARFDTDMTLRLFPEIRDVITPISGGERQGVERLYAALVKAVDSMKAQVEVFAIVDHDARSLIPKALGANAHTWDRYHIENYLLEETFIKRAMEGLPSYSRKLSVSELSSALLRCAADTIPSLIHHELTVFLDSEIKSQLDLGYDRGKQRPSEGLNEALDRVLERLKRKRMLTLSCDSLTEKENSLRGEMQKALSDGTWIQKFRGRDILRKFCGEYLPGLPFEAFRDVIVDKMRIDGFQPEGMRAVINRVLE